MADSNTELDIVVKMVDQTTATIDQIRSKFGSFEASVAELNATMQQTPEEVDAWVEAGGKLNDFGMMVGELPPKVEEVGVAMAETGAEAESAGSAFGEFGDRAESMFERLAVKATVIAAVIAGFSYLKDAVKEAEDANKTYTDQFEKSTDALDKQKVAIGDNFLPALELLKQTFVAVTEATNNATQKDNDFEQSMTLVAKVLASALIYFDEYPKALGGFAALMEGVVIAALDGAKREIGYVGEALDDFVHGRFGKAFDDMKNVVNIKFHDVSGMITGGTEQITEDLGKANDEWQKVWSFQDPASLSQTPSTESKSNSGLTSSLQSASNDFDKLKTDITEKLASLDAAHTVATKDIQDKMDNLAQTYAKTGQEGADALEKLAESHAAAMQSIENSIDSVDQAIEKENESFAKTTASNVQTLAQAFKKASDEVTTLKEKLDSWQTPDAIANSQIDIQNLQAKMAEATTPVDQSNLQLQIDNAKAKLAIEQQNDAQAKQAAMDQMTADQAALDANKDLATQYSDEITEVNKSALQQAVDTFGQKQVAAQQDHDRQMANYQSELAALKQKTATEIEDYNESVIRSQADTALKASNIRKQMDDYTEQQKEEQDLYDAKEKEINNILEAAELERQKASNATFDKVKANIEAEIALYNRLSQAMTSTMGAHAVSELSAIPKFADGGIVTSPTLALVGEAGPEIITPLNKAGGMSGINIVINNPTVRNNGDLAAMKQQIEQVLRPLLQNAKLNYV